MAENPINKPPPITLPPGLENTTNQTILDAGHPSSKYSSTNTYLDNYQGARSNNSSFGTEGTDIKPKSVFETTGLDVENPKAGTKQGGTGGPNRTNSSNIPNGQYISIGTNNLFGFKFKNHLGVLYNKEGTPVITKLHQYTPKNTYISLLRGKPEL